MICTCPRSIVMHCSRGFVALLFVCGICSTCASEALFVESGAIGVSQCTMQGTFGGEHATLNLWIRAVVKLTGDSQRPKSTLHVKGFSFFESVEQAWFGPQLLNSMKSVASFSFQIRIRPLKGEDFLELESWSMNRRPKNKVLPFWGNFSVEAPTSALLPWEYSLSAAGVDYSCQLMAEVHDQTSTAPAKADSKMLGKPGQTSFLLSPFYGASVPAYASVLAWHIAWHKKFGVGLHVLYVTKQMTDLLDSPMIQMLVQRGLLKLVLWQDMPIPKKGTPYAHQVIIYNHGMLSLNSDDSVVVVADLDEFLITPEPNSVKQVMSSCATPGSPVSTLLISRFSIINMELAAQGVPDLGVWMLKAANSSGSAGANAALALPNLQEHPLLAYHTHAEFKPLTGPDVYELKPLQNPALLKSVYVHGGFPVHGARMIRADPTCAKWLHVVNLHKSRQMEKKRFEIEAKWMWPVVVDGESA